MDPYKTPKGKLIVRDFRIIQRSLWWELFSSLIVILPLIWIFSRDSGDDSGWTPARVGNALRLPVIIIIGRLAVDFFFRRSSEKKLRSHPVLQQRHTICASNCSISGEGAVSHSGWAFLTTRSVVLDLQETPGFPAAGTKAISEYPLEDIEEVAVEKRRLVLSGSRISRLELNVHSPKLWRELIEEAKAQAKP